MKRFCLVIGLAVVLLAAIEGWRIAKSSRSGPMFPIEISVDRVVTKPHVAIGSAVLILAPDGSVWAWGENKVGATDEGGLLAAPGIRGQWHSPRRLEVGSNWIALAAGYTDAIGIKADGSLWGWTFNPIGSYWSLGVCTNPPAQLAPGTNWSAVATGAGHALVLRKDGTLWALGINHHGQVGDGNISRHPPGRGPLSVTPLTQIGTNRNWVAIAATVYTSLGLQSDGTLWHWGQIQAVSPVTGHEIKLSLPTRVDEGTNWSAISAGEFCFVGLKHDGRLWTWGANAHLLGCGSQTNPCLVSPDSNWAMAASGLGMLVALQQDGTLWQAGMAYDEYGGPNRTRKSATPALLGSRQDWVEVWSGGGMSFGLTKDGILWTWNFRPDNSREGSEAMEKASIWLKRHGVPGPTYVRRPIGSDTPWPLVRFVTNASPRAR